MNYLAVKDLKKGKLLRETLEREKEIVLTRDGQPFAVMFGVSPDTAEESVVEVRRALFSAAIARVRRRALKDPPPNDLVERSIASSRKARAAK